MAKNLFKTQNIVDTAVNVVIGGGANAAIDYAFSSVDMLAEYQGDTKNLIKFGFGVVCSSMVSNKYIKAAMDGIATVGISNYINDMMQSTGTETTAGLPAGMIGRRPRYVPARQALARSMRKQGIRGPQGLME